MPRLAILCIVLFALSCGGGSPTTPTAPTTPVPAPPVPSPPPPPTGITGVLTDGLSSTRLAGVLVKLDGIGETTSAADGSFAFAAADPQVERTITLMPSSIDLPAFNEMFRGSGGELHRWAAAPRLVIQRRVLQFTSVSASTYTALGTMLSDEEVATLIGDLEWALPQLTGGTFSAFAGRDVETADEGASVAVSRSGAVVVARYEGLTAGSGFWGYGRWAWNGLGEVQMGIMMLDRAFETSGSSFRRSLRAHELGHTLGYTHVTLRESVMQSHARHEPTPWDRDAARLAFQRPPRNRAPDTDPQQFVGNLHALASQLTWAGSH